jgi:hypothetical protein
MNRSNSLKLFLLLALFLSPFSCDIIVKAQGKSESAALHYVLPDFVKGTVKMKNGATETAIMNYNMITEEMIFEKGDTRLAMVNIETIDTVYLDSRKFIPHEKVFYEVLIRNSISLFKRHRCNLMKAGAPAAYGGTSETSATTSISVLISSGSMYKLELPSEYRVRDASQYLITINGAESRIAGERQFLKLFPDKSEELAGYIRQNKLDIRKEEDLKILINKCNELLY